MTGQPLTRIARGREQDIDIAVCDAHGAYPAWRKLPVQARARICAPSRQPSS